MWTVYCSTENPFNGIESKELAQDKKLRKRLKKGVAKASKTGQRASANVIASLLGDWNPDLAGSRRTRRTRSKGATPRRTRRAGRSANPWFWF